MMVGRGDDLGHISTSPITINTLSVIMKVLVADILIPNSTYSIITSTTTSYIFTKIIIDTTIINRYIQQYAMVAWVMGGRLAGLGPVSTSLITINGFFHIEREKVAGIFLGLYSRLLP